MKEHVILGHILAVITILIWGTTFIFTKVLLKEFSPEEILWYRFILAFIVLACIYPQNLKVLSYKDERLFFLLGLTGVTLYYWTESLALKYSSVSNVGLIVSAIPLFTAFMMHFINREKKLPLKLFLGGTIALMGIGMIVYHGQTVSLSPVGDLLAVCAAMVFSIYSILIQKVQDRYSSLLIITKVFFYGIITIFPIFIFSYQTRSTARLLMPHNIGNMLFLVVFASLACFMMWNKSIQIIGSVRTTSYIYFVPIITMAASFILLNETIDTMMIVGGIFIFIGVYINDKGSIKKILLNRK
ncbi:DMT family transporter [Cellulosilyticum sp. I15G10I2]|uniref:DMT family transporter n=1 Tax=Cellulosilyticum sp. I15G10I2 TaxID=1892843 RepID=UPI00085C4158|nr:DMT family transporter [Cellulosilyticum sp. I15G10I2]